MKDPECTTPVSFGQFNQLHNTHQFNDIACFCPLLFPGTSALARVFFVKKENSEWKGYWVFGCGSYKKDVNNGCGLWGTSYSLSIIEHC